MHNPVDVPLLAALTKSAWRDHAAFYAPGHKQGQGASPLLTALLGDQVMKADLPELPELDNLFAPDGVIQRAQQLAAKTFGSDATFFLTNGSTGGIEAAILATCSPADRVLVPRNAHRSVLSALILSGAQPVYLDPICDPDWDLAYGVTPEQIDIALDCYPDISTVVVVSPSYHGVCADIVTMATQIHGRSGILIVDEAHGPHLGFHPQLPPSAIAGGADIVIQSTHKVLSALTQAAMLHVQGPRVDRDRLRQALQLTQSTSPNYLLLASLDAARAQMATDGYGLMAKTLAISHHVRLQLESLLPLKSLTLAAITAISQGFQLDPTRLTVDVSGLGLTGFAADEQLHEQLGVTAELPTLRQLAFIISLGNTIADGERLLLGLVGLINQASGGSSTTISTLSPFPQVREDCRHGADSLSRPPLSPRQAFFATSRFLPIMDAVSHISADILCPYPPGIPIVLPGEVITAAAMTQLRHIQAAGGVITGASDPTLQTLRIIETD